MVVRKYNLIFFQSEYSLVIDLPEPDATCVEERKRLRIENEDEKFDDDHYLADLFDNDLIEESILAFTPDFYEKSNVAEATTFTQQEMDCLKSLKKKTYLLDKEEKFHAFMGLVDILFSYCYNHRVNCGEMNVEAGWTIAKLSSTLAWFDVKVIFS
jgi:protein SHQ1